MRYISIFSAAALLLLAVFINAEKFSFTFQQQKGKGKPNPTFKNYAEAWKIIDSLEKRSLPKTGLAYAEAVYNKAKTEKNAPQQTKSAIYIMKFKNAFEEDAGEKNIRWLKKEAEASYFPAKQIMFSILGEQYLNYYNQNSYNILQKGITSGNAPDSLSHWNARHFEHETKRFYLLSIENQAQLEKEPIEKYSLILTNDSSENRLVPNLYDLLARRAIGYLMSPQSQQTQASVPENINDQNIILPLKAFLEAPIYGNETEDNRLLAFEIYKKILRGHLTRDDKEALAELDVERLQRAHSVLNSDKKDSLFYAALLDLENEYKNHKASAIAAFQRAKFIYEGYKPFNTNSKLNLPQTALSICDSILKKFPKSHGANLCFRLKESILTQEISFNTPQLFLPGKPVYSTISYRNTAHVFYNIISISENDFRNWNKFQYKGIDSAYMAIRKNASKIIKGKIELPNSDDLLLHRKKHELNSLENGHYILVFSQDSGFKKVDNLYALNPFAVSNLRAVEQNRGFGAHYVFVTNATNGKPEKDAEVKLFVQEYNRYGRDWNYKHVKTLKTDKDGKIEIEPTTNYINYAMEIRKGKDVLFQYQGVSSGPKTQPENIVTTQTVFFTDRSIYRPGQIVYFKGITYNKNAEKTELQKAYTTTVSFFDANYQLIQNIDVTTNEYGSFSGSFTVPTGRLTGNYTIRENSGSTNIQVEEYNRPNFEVKIDTQKASYRLNENIKITGTAETYSGAALNNAKVKYRVVRNVYWPYRYFWRMPQPNINEREITNGTIKTNAAGKFEFDFTALPDATIPKENKPFFTYTIYADVTDQSGETQSTQKSLNVAYQSLLATINMAEWVNKKSVINYTITTQNLSGQNINTTGNLILEKLKEPAKPEHTEAFFYDDIYGRKHFSEADNMQERPEAEKTYLKKSVPTNSGLNLTEAELKILPTGRYRAVFETTDNFGQKVEAEHYFTVYDEDGKKAAFTTFSYLTPHKTTVEPGQKATFIWGSSVDANAYVVIEQEGKILVEKWIDVNNGQQKIELDIKEENRGGLHLHLFTVVEGKAYTYTEFINVAWPKRDLTIETKTFRDKLKPGENESWTFTVKDAEGKLTKAEFLAGMYDASLDAFLPHNWNFNLYESRSSTIHNNTLAGAFLQPVNMFYRHYQPDYNHNHNYRNINYFGFRADYLGYGQTFVVRKELKSFSDQDANTSNENKESLSDVKFLPPQTNAQNGNEEPQKSQLRKNKQETAFFYPQLLTGDNGEISFSFTAPDALTRWKLMLFAHTQDLKYGQLTKNIVTQKELMVQPNLPRFLREGDEIVFTSKIINLTGNDMNGAVYLKIFDPVTSKMIYTELAGESTNMEQPFHVVKMQSSVKQWRIKIPKGLEAIQYQIVAKSGNFSDGEEGIIPVLPGRILITETKPYYLRGNQSKNIVLKSLLEVQNSKTKTPYKLVLENTSNPAWFAVQALPYLAANNNENTDAIFNRFYANALAQHIIKQQPEIKKVFESWLRNTSGTNALQSNLEKNQDLKSVLLEETPWVQDAKDETQRKRNIALLFDENNLNNGLGEAIAKLEQTQLPDGAWPWFAGMQGDRFITQSIVAGFSKLHKMGVRTDYLERIRQMTTKAILYLDEKATEDYNRLLKLKDFKKENNYLNPTMVQYLYIRSLNTQLSLLDPYKKAYSFWLVQAVKQWQHQPIHQKAMLAVALFNLDEKKPAHDILHSIDEHALRSDEFGMYWKELSSGGMYWYNQSIGTQALLIEAYDLVEHDDEAVEEMKIWLLQQKQTQIWDNDRSTAEAIYALLLKGSKMLAPQPPVKVFLGDALYGNENNTEAGTGYNTTVLNGNEIKSAMGNIKVSSTAEGLIWGSIYYQYYDEINEVKQVESALSVTKQVFVQHQTKNGIELKPCSPGTILNTGDVVVIQLKIKTNRAMEYIHLKDMRAAALEPGEVLSGYKWQQGLGYYQSVKDASMNYFIQYLPKGDHMVEYSLKVNQTGNFSNGISTIQCLYAPGFSGHSGGSKISVNSEQ